MDLSSFFKLDSHFMIAQKQNASGRGVSFMFWYCFEMIWSETDEEKNVIYFNLKGPHLNKCK